MITLPDKPLRGLSLYHPWAWALFFAGKDVENRPWYSSFRGWVAVQVSKHWSQGEVLATLFEIEVAARRAGNFNVVRPNIEKLKAERGHIVGLIEIDDWRPAHLYDSPWAFDEGYAAHVARAIAIEPVLCTGSLGLFRLPAPVEQQVREGFVRAVDRLCA